MRANGDHLLQALASHPILCRPLDLDSNLRAGQALGDMGLPPKKQTPRLNVDRLGMRQEHGFMALAKLGHEKIFEGAGEHVHLSWNLHLLFDGIHVNETYLQ